MRSNDICTSRVGRLRERRERWGNVSLFFYITCIPYIQTRQGSFLTHSLTHARARRPLLQTPVIKSIFNHHLACLLYNSLCPWWKTKSSSITDFLFDLAERNGSVNYFNPRNPNTRIRTNKSLQLSSWRSRPWCWPGLHSPARRRCGPVLWWSGWW